MAIASRVFSRGMPRSSSSCWTTEFITLRSNIYLVVIDLLLSFEKSPPVWRTSHGGSVARFGGRRKTNWFLQSCPSHTIALSGAYLYNRTQYHAHIIWRTAEKREKEKRSDCWRAFRIVGSFSSLHY